MRTLCSRSSATTADEHWTNKAGKPFRPGIHYYVGGNTKFYGAALLRMRKSDFGQVQHHGGLSPEWPITYEDLEPYYTRAEHLYRVHGEHGVDPTEPRSKCAISVSGGFRTNRALRNSRATSNASAFIRFRSLSGCD